MKRLVFAVGAIVLPLIAVAAVTYAVPPLVLRDAPAPPSVAPLVEDARHSIVGSSRVFPRPLYPRLIDTRCFEADLVAFYFEEWVPPYLDLRYAVAVGELHPPFGVHSWEGGYHLESLPDSYVAENFAAEFGKEVACE